MNQSTRFKVNAPKVIYEVFDDEIVVINMDTGNYYSIDKVGSDIWSLLEVGNSCTEVLQGIKESYQGSGYEIESSLHSFIEELLKEQLIIPRGEHAGPAEGAAAKQEKRQLVAERSVFKSPNMQKFSDMQSLLLLDPIHEVDEKGWPSAKQDLN